MATSERHSKRSAVASATPPAAAPDDPANAVTLGAHRVVAAIAGLPPLGIFTSEFLIVSATLAKQPLLALPLVLGLLIAIGALFLHLNRIAFGEPKGPNHKVKCSYVPMILHLGLVLIAGVYLPATLVAWFQAVAKLLG